MLSLTGYLKQDCGEFVLVKLCFWSLCTCTVVQRKGTAEGALVKVG